MAGLSETILTDELRALVGVEGPLRTAPEPLGADTLRRFVQAAMEPDPIHWDADAARARGYDGIVAPPLFPLHAFPRRRRHARSVRRARRRRRTGTGSSSSRTACRRSSSRCRGCSTAASRRRCSTSRGSATSSPRARATRSMTERAGRSGPMVLVVVETDYRNQRDELLLRTRTTMIAR